MLTPPATLGTPAKESRRFGNSLQGGGGWHKASVSDCLPTGGGGGFRGAKFSPWDISQRAYFACSPEFAVGNFAPTCCADNAWRRQTELSTPLRTAMRNVRSQDPPLQILTATFLCFSSCGRAQETYAQATVGQDILLNFAAGLFRTAA